jgi:hypothetical protein
VTSGSRPPNPPSTLPISVKDVGLGRICVIDGAAFRFTPQIPVLSEVTSWQLYLLETLLCGRSVVRDADGAASEGLRESDFQPGRHPRDFVPCVSCVGGSRKHKYDNVR